MSVGERGRKQREEQLPLHPCDDLIRELSRSMAALGSLDVSATTMTRLLLVLLSSHVAASTLVPMEAAPVLTSPVFSLATAVDGKTNMNMLTYATPVGIRPQRLWAMRGRLLRMQRDAPFFDLSRLAEGQHRLASAMWGVFAAGRPPMHVIAARPLTL